MRKSFLVGLFVVLLFSFTLPATAEEPPDSPRGLDVVGLVLDWLGLSASQAAPPDSPPPTAKPDGHGPRANESDESGPRAEIGPINDPGG